MGFILYISDYIMPFVIFYIIALGLMNGIKVYEAFVEGAKEGFRIVAEICPTFVGLMIGVGVLRASGLLDWLGNGIGSLFATKYFPPSLVPLVIVRLFSSSAATGLALDIFKSYGVDTYIGSVTSIMMSCTETVFYTMSVYFMAAKVTRTRWTLCGALLATLAGIMASVALAGWM